MNHQYFEGNNVTASVRDLIPVAELLSAGAVPTATEFIEKRVIYGYFGQETIGYRGKLFVTGALRVDGASTFGQEDRWQAFPKASLSYVVSTEPWWQNSVGSIFNRFKFRTAFGTSGGQPAGSYDRFSVYVQQSNSNAPAWSTPLCWAMKISSRSACVSSRSAPTSPCSMTGWVSKSVFTISALKIYCCRERCRLPPAFPAFAIMSAFSRTKVMKFWEKP
jgi:hypothetical protein